jgi:hypothetical protein
MNNINNKLEKYRFKLINANTSEKAELYIVKMQYYLIMQKQLLKSGGKKDINNKQNQITEAINNITNPKETFQPPKTNLFNNTNTSTNT